MEYYTESQAVDAFCRARCADCRLNDGCPYTDKCEFKERFIAELQKYTPTTDDAIRVDQVEKDHDMFVNFCDRYFQVTSNQGIAIRALKPRMLERLKK